MRVAAIGEIAEKLVDELEPGQHSGARLRELKF